METRRDSRRSGMAALKEQTRPEPGSPRTKQDLNECARLPFSSGMRLDARTSALLFVQALRCAERWAIAATGCGCGIEAAGASAAAELTAACVEWLERGASHLSESPSDWQQVWHYKTMLSHPSSSHFKDASRVRQKMPPQLCAVCCFCRRCGRLCSFPTIATALEPLHCRPPQPQPHRSS